MSAVDLIAIVVNACGLGGALLGIAVVATRTRQPENPPHAGALIVLLAILAADVASSIFDLTAGSGAYPGLVWASLLLWPWIPVCLWIYVDALIRESGAPPGRYRRHGAVAVIGTVCLLPFFTLPAGTRSTLMHGAVTVDAHVLFAVLGFAGFFLLWVSSMLVVGAKTVRALAAHRRRMRELLSDASAADLRWIDGFMLFVGAGVAATIVEALLGVTTGTELMNAPVSALFETGIIAGLVLFGVHQDRAVPAWADEPDIVPPAPEPHSGPETSPEPRYARSSLTIEDCAAIVARLDAAMRSDEPWRNPLLDLKMLAERIATKPYYVTQALNTVHQRNFYDYVNGWRVRAAAAALVGGDASVLSICEEVGFNSKSTFNAMFRKEMNATPTAYRREHAALAPS